MRNQTPAPTRHRSPQATRARVLRATLLAALVVGLGACTPGTGFDPFARRGASIEETPDTGIGRVTLIERDVEAPEVFERAAYGKWDGRPTLGGVWVSHDTVTAPERAIIRNTDAGTFVIGALFPRKAGGLDDGFVVSSDAAAALDMTAGEGAPLQVTALRRVAETAADAAPAAAGPATTAPGLDPADASATPQTPAPAASSYSALDKPYLQIGIFSVEQNARNAATAMRQDGMLPTVKEHSLNDKTFWRVLVGPAGNLSERTALLRKIRALGFEDAYPVTD